MAAPTLVSYNDATAAWNLTNSPKATASISWQIGDVVVAILISEGADTFAVPTTTGSGLVFLSQKSSNTANTCGTQLAAGVATASSSGTISANNGGTGLQWGMGVWVFRGSAGIGNSAEQHTATRTVGLIPAVVDSAIVWGIGDFHADTVQTVLPTPTNARQALQSVGKYTVYVDDLADQSSGGSTSYGVGGANAGPFSIVVLEIKASSSSLSPDEDFFMPRPPQAFDPPITVW